MHWSLPVLFSLLGAAPAIETQFVQVAPARPNRSWWSTPGQGRAVVLIHGLFVHPLSKTNVAQARLHRRSRPARDRRSHTLSTGADTTA